MDYQKYNLTNTSIMKKKNLLLTLAFAAMPVMAQMPDTELPDPHPAPASAWQGVTKAALGWGNIDTQYGRNAVPRMADRLDLYAWRGERVSAQALVLVPQGGKVTFSVSDLRNGRHVIPAEAVNRYFVRYVMSDSLRQGEYLVPDRLDPARELTAEAQTVRPLWLDIRVPQTAAPGKYRGTLTAHVDGTGLTIPFTLEVGRRTLPEPSEWAFHLDLWQNPYSVARFYGVKLWSKEHFDRMRPMMKELAAAGQKVITASIIKHPWNGQTEDAFESMIGKTLTQGGEWRYDYRVFDRWVEFMMDCGITEQIDCYTIVPWHLLFEYYDEARNCTVQEKLAPGSKEYEDYLIPFLKDFARHLKEKGWFGKTCIAMDERPKSLLEPAYAVLYKADPGFRVKGAINYFGPEVSERMYDISFSFNQPLLTPQQIAAHRSKGHKVTFYTCTGHVRPNTFVKSRPAEAAWLGWHTAAADYDGYLRWAFNSWVKNPWQDSRFVRFEAGDCFLVYPGGTSVRWERLVEGIEDFEKIRVLRSELKGKKLQRLNDEIKKFSPVKVEPGTNVENMVRDAQKLLNTL